MKKKIDHLPNKIPVFPLSNFIIFPRTTVPLNVFEPRYIDMVDDEMKSNRIIGMIQPKKSDQNIPLLYNVGCAGKITSFSETDDGRYLIVLSGISRFKIIKELENDKLYRECSISFNDFSNDLEKNKEEIKFSDLELIFKYFGEDKDSRIISKKIVRERAKSNLNTENLVSIINSVKKKAARLTTQLKFFKLYECL